MILIADKQIYKDTNTCVLLFIPMYSTTILFKIQNIKIRIDYEIDSRQTSTQRDPTHVYFFILM